jgi:hypothetical protein
MQLITGRRYQPGREFSIIVWSAGAEVMRGVTKMYGICRSFISSCHQEKSWEVVLGPFLAATSNRPGTKNGFIAFCLTGD